MIAMTLKYTWNTNAKAGLVLDVALDALTRYASVGLSDDGHYKRKCLSLMCLVRRGGLLFTIS